VRTLPGLGTPDLHGRLGVGTEFSTEVGLAREERKTAFVALQERGRDRYAGVLEGPTRRKRKGTHTSSLDLELELLGDESARLTIGEQAVELTKGEWSPIIALSFRVGRILSIRALTRVILTQVRPEIRLYSLPLQIHPLNSPWRYASPRSFVQDTWKACGPFLTIGWPQDTTGLEEGCISDSQFLDLSLMPANVCSCGTLITFVRGYWPGCSTPWIGFNTCSGTATRGLPTNGMRSWMGCSEEWKTVWALRVILRPRL